ncbi:pseudouridine-5'-phosphate glycosidase [Rheinheimera riviphila]|uniref:Pseudouridine-5'-phosphate glycosidase n=1 Tax=Rheinheimera riviphila TaxID=1834037 RepID=A0A437QLJ2_9GAMM|nr:pseudouridine-5'-phosphate glycosidase [Rheinheimera riviphila]RVU35393.1 pseudouridine-5'-phosphate glycosidase [Rheinheimera riviphila]
MALPIRYSAEVQEALAEQQAVVALESNVICQGLDYPLNLQTALALEQRVRAQGAVPATLAVLHGEIRVGLTGDELAYLATRPQTPKISSRDLAFVLAGRSSGATTVACSLQIAAHAGIRFFASAGLGGVHRGAQQSMDISGDLIELTRSGLAVVCAGAKNILDLGLTLEFLETHNVPVVSYQFDDFPAFYCRSSGFKAPKRLDDPWQLAAAIEWQQAIAPRQSMLICTPTPVADALDGAVVEQAIAAATRQAEQAGIIGNALTRFIMKAVEQATAGQSALANQAVLLHTTEVAAELAVIHARFCQQHQHHVADQATG